MPCLVGLATISGSPLLRSRVITAEADAQANMENSPNRSQISTAFASVISAPITVNSFAVAQPFAVNTYAKSEGPGFGDFGCVCWRRCPTCPMGRATEFPRDDH